MPHKSHNLNLFLLLDSANLFCVDGGGDPAVWGPCCLRPQAQQCPLDLDFWFKWEGSERRKRISFFCHLKKNMFLSLRPWLQQPHCFCPQFCSRRVRVRSAEARTLERSHIEDIASLLGKSWLGRQVTKEGFGETQRLASRWGCPFIRDGGLQPRKGNQGAASDLPRPHRPGLPASGSAGTGARAFLCVRGRGSLPGCLNRSCAGEQAWCHPSVGGPMARHQAPCLWGTGPVPHPPNTARAAPALLPRRDDGFSSQRGCSSRGQGTAPCTGSPRTPPMAAPKYGLSL